MFLLIQFLAYQGPDSGRSIISADTEARSQNSGKERLGHIICLTLCKLDVKTQMCKANKLEGCWFVKESSRSINNLAHLSDSHESPTQLKGMTLCLVLSYRA